MALAEGVTVALDRLHGSTQENRLQDRAGDAIASAERRAKASVGALAGGVLLQDLAVKAASFTAFPHGLGKVWSGYVLAGATVDVRIFHERTGDDDREIRLKSSTDATVSVVIF